MDCAASTAEPARSATAQQLTVADLVRLGQRSGFDYRFPQLEAQRGDIGAICVACGQVQEHVLRPGLKLVLSDLQVQHSYQSHSHNAAALSVSALLQGQAEVRLNASERAAGNSVALRARHCAGMVYDEATALSGHHAAGQRLRSVSIVLEQAQALGADPQLAEWAQQALRPSRPQLQRWALDRHLLQTLQALFAPAMLPAAQALLREGLALQMLAQALQPLAATDQRRASAAGTSEVKRQHAATRLSERDRRLLARVHEQLRAAPGQAYTLHELAQLACMSPSVLRVKFQLAYGCTVFDWLRSCRLEQARQQLEQGSSIAQAALLAGYAHPTNFTAAFRAHFGLAPSAWLRQR